MRTRCWWRHRSAKLLGVARVGALDGFFDLGGHSLLAVRLVSVLAAATGKELAVRAVFEHPTVEGLARVLGGLSAGGLAAIGLADRSGRLALSFQQERLWFLSRLEAGAGAAYNITGALRLLGALDVAALRSALAAIVARHESLRTRFAVADGRPVQVIGTGSGIGLAQEDATGLTEAGLAARVTAVLEAPFDLERGPLFRAHLLRRGAEEHVLVVGGHHTVLDGWSVGLLLREASALYRGETLAGLAIQYADYAGWQRSTLAGARLAEQTAYWREQLEGAPAAIALPLDRARPAAMDYRGGRVGFAVPAAVTAGLNGLARSQGATLFMVLQAALAALLHRVGGDEDLVIGTAVAGRGRVELEPLAGFFANTLALRHRVRGEMGFTALLGSVRTTVLEAFDHQAVPFEAVVEAVGPVRSLRHGPVVQVMLVLQNQQDAGRGLELPGITVAPFAAEQGTAQFELLVDLTETAAGLAGSLSYASALFDRSSAERLAAQFCRVLAGIAAEPATAVRALPVLGLAERLEVVAGFNATAAAYPRGTVLDLFEAQVMRTPQAIAVVDGERETSYRALASAARRLGRHLIGLGVGPETVVGVCLDRSAGLIEGLLGVFAAGGGYLPLDPDYPAERLGFMLGDAAAPVVLTTRAHAAHLTGATGIRLVVLDDAATAAAIAAQPDGPIAAVGTARAAGPRQPGLCDLHLGLDRPAQGGGGAAWRGGEPAAVAARPGEAGTGRCVLAEDAGDVRRVGVGAVRLDRGGVAGGAAGAGGAPGPGRGVAGAAAPRGDDRALRAEPADGLPGGGRAAAGRAVGPGAAAGVHQRRGAGGRAGGGLPPPRSARWADERAG